MTDFDKLSHEHRVAWRELMSIQDSKDGSSVKIERIIRLFDDELLPHFKDEEDNVLSDDAMSREIMAEHREIYGLIDLMRSGKASGADVDEFISLLKGHIKKEDAYFGHIEEGQRRAGNSLSFTLAILAAVVVASLLVFARSDQA